MRCSTLVMEIAIVFLAPFLWVASSEMAKPAETEPVLSDYPELFGKDVMIMIGNNENGIEIERADAIVENLFNRTGNMPVVKTAADSPTANSSRGVMNARRSTRGSWCGMAILIAFAAMLAVCTLPASALTCEYDMCVNETGWWNASGAFNASGTPIQAAINNAAAGTIYVWNGSYTENVDVNKTLTLAGEGAGVVDVTNSTADNHVFNVTADYVNISGFNVTGATGSEMAGIYLSGRQHCNISNNTASNNQYGIYLSTSSNNTLTNNTASNNSDHGIYLYPLSNFNTLTNNTLSNNSDHGILLYSSSNFNTLTNNTADSNNEHGIYLASSSNNMLTDNTADSNNYGIFLYISSNFNTLTNNTADSNNYGIILHTTSNNNMLTNNTASNNGFGIYLYSSSSNTIYNNYFNNTNNAYDNGNNIWNTTPTAGTNIIGGSWLGGNYWSDYTGSDTNGDGLGDNQIPYSSGISTGGDYHPLVQDTVKYTPPDPKNIQRAYGNFWVNHTWDAGDGNVTDSYNVSVNGVWHNTTKNTFWNDTYTAHVWQNITVYAWNSRSTGTLSSGNVTQDAQIPNNLITITNTSNWSGNAGNNVYVDYNATDPDGDTPTFSCNRTDFITNFNTSTGQGNWTATTGTYYVDFGVSDGWGSTSNYTMTIMVDTTPPAPTDLQSTTSNYWVNYTWTVGSGIATDGYNVSINNAWDNVTDESYNSFVGAGNWSNITVWAWNATGSGNMSATSVSDTVQAPAAPAGAPNITSWSNNKTNNDSTTIMINESESVRFNATANQAIDIWNWHDNGALVQSNDFDNYTASWSINGTRTVSVNGTNANGTSSPVTWTITVTDITPPASITDLNNVTYEQTYINWTWADPADDDFEKVMIYLDGTFKTNVSEGVWNYTATGLDPGTEYTIGTHTVDTSGNVNETWMNDTARTLPAPDIPIQLTITLNSGWNLISAPLNLNTWELGEESAVGDPLNVTPENSLASVYRYDTTTELFEMCIHYAGWGWDTAAGSESFTELEPGRGYWVMAYNDCTLTFTGTAPSDLDISIDADWNCIGWYSTSVAELGQESLVVDPLNVRPDNSLASVYRYNTTSELFEMCIHYDGWGWDTASGSESFTELKPGRGYWVMADSNCVWNHET